jgi:hypothetical protein
MRNSVYSVFIAILLVIFFFLFCKKEKSCEGCIVNKPPVAIAWPAQIITLTTGSKQHNSYCPGGIKARLDVGEIISAGFYSVVISDAEGKKLAVGKLVVN